MIRSSILAAALAAVSFPIHAADIAAPKDEKTALAIQVLEVTKFDNIVKAMQQQVGAGIRSQFPQYADCADAQPVMDEFVGAVSDKVAQTVGSDDFKADIAAIYSESFSAEELREIIDFYQSPLGRKWIERMPELMQKSMQISQSRLQAMTPEITAIGETYGKRLNEASKMCKADVPAAKPAPGKTKH
jgi:uncharacterized protein